MKKIAIFAVSISLVFSALAQDDEKQEAAKEASISPAVVHEDVQKKTTINAPAAPVQAHTSTAVTVIPSSTNESKSDLTKVASQNTALVMFGGGVLAYFLFVWFLSFASRTPAVAMSITRGIYYIVGFPVVLTFVTFRLLRGMSATASSANYQSESDDKHYSASEKSTYKNHDSSISEKGNNEHQRSRISGNSQRTSSQDNESDGERIVVQVNLKNNWYNRVTMAKGSSSGQISKKLQEIAYGERNKEDFKGRVRAIGEQSKRVYDIIS